MQHLWAYFHAIPQMMTANQRKTGNMLILDNISKVYCGLSTMFRPHLAVDGVTVGIQHGECFGLLGLNGTGKTSIFKMLSGNAFVTSGSAYINGVSITDNVKKVAILICPCAVTCCDECCQFYYHNFAYCTLAWM